jgi:myo-inositol 2-dehydrogenase/D-chiro-inositol 1-dehydrogenase
MTLRVGIIGTGLIGADHGRRITHALSGAEVVAVADIDLDAARQLAAELKIGTVQRTGHELIADDAVDAVLVASPAATHEAYAIAAIESGKPVFCEKPLATTERACRDIMAAEFATGRRLLQVGFMRRYDPAYQALKQALADGEIGTPLLYYSTHRTAAAPLGWSGDMAIVDAAVHDFDISRWLLGAEFTGVQVFAGRQNGRSPNLRDPLVMMLETTSGVLVNVETSLNIDYGYDIRGEAVGEFGTATLADFGRGLPRSGATGGLAMPQDWRERFADAYDRELQVWINAAIAGEGATGPSAWDGYVAQVVSDAASTSLHARQHVAVELIERPAIYE